MLGIDQCADAGMSEEISFRIFLGSLGFVEDHSNRNASLVGIDQSFGDWGRGKRIGLDKDVAFGGIQLLDDRLGAATIRTKVSADIGWIGEGGDGDDERQNEEEEAFHAAIVASDWRAVNGGRFLLCVTAVVTMLAHI